MYTISKTYHEIPFGHRQPNHEGHCSQLHGHNWSLKFTFGAHTRDQSGFVLDFGGLKTLKKFIDENLDHKMLFNIDDSEMHRVTGSTKTLSVTWVEDCSCEGIAKFMFDTIHDILQKEFSDGVQNRGLKCLFVEVFEDSRNSATYSPEV